MTDEKIIKVLEEYKKFLDNIGALSMEEDFLKHPRSEIDMMSHLQSMIPQMIQFIRKSRREKVFRWLGFMQGVLWATKKFTLNELKDHSKPDK